jgi:hypothetical protein
VSSTTKKEAPADRPQRDKSTDAEARDYRIPDKSPWRGAWRIVGGVGVAGLVVGLLGWKSDPERFAFSYLFAFVVPLTLALGSLFFTLILYVSKAHWGITVRRVSELFFRPMPLFAILVIPLVLSLQYLFPWEGAKHSHQTRAPVAEVHDAHGSPAAGQRHEAAGESPLAEGRGDPSKEPAGLRSLPVANAHQMERSVEREEKRIVDHKRPYLNRYFFLGRLILYLLVWTWLAQRYFQWSTEQDKSKALKNTAEAQRFAPPSIILFGLCLSFFGFDWLLSLDATWYSTMFGVYFFAMTALFQFACLIAMTLALRGSNLLGDAVTVEHFHDLGKLLFGFIAFWTYIAFAQFFLTWYSNIPDELVWFNARWRDNGGTWKGIGLALIVMHFIVPFWFLMSRNIKRRLPMLGAGAVCMIVMHIIEVYWVVMPNYGPLQVSYVDVALLIGLLGIYLAEVLRGYEQYSLIPIGDPRLSRALEFEQA